MSHVEGRSNPFAIQLAEGVSWKEVGIFAVVVSVALCASSFQSLMQPYVFRELLGIAPEVQGRLGGTLTTIQQSAVLIFIGLMGAFSDRIGRRNTLLLAVVGYGTLLMVYPLIASIAMLFVVRFLFGISSTAHTTGGATRIVADYPAEQSRGKFISMMLVFQAAAVALFTGLIGAHIPEWLIAGGMTPRAAGQTAFIAMGCVAFVGAAFGAAFLSKNRAIDRVKPTAGKPLNPFASLGQNCRELYAYSKVNPRFGFIMLAGLVIRSDTIVVLDFLSLWVVNQAHAQGLTTAEGTRIAGQLIAVFNAAIIVTPPLFGFLADRVNRFGLFIGALCLTSTALMMTGVVHSVTGWGIFGAVAFIGLAEGAQTIASQTVFGQEAPPHLRGSAMGVLATIGTVSVLVVTISAGFLFDRVGYTAPFMLTACLHIAFLIVVGSVFLVRRGTRPAVA